MSSVYPISIDDFTTTHNPTDPKAGHAAVHNKIGDALEKMQTELGTNPSAAFASVASRFASVDNLQRPLYFPEDDGGTGDGTTNAYAAITATIARVDQSSPGIGGVVWLGNKPWRIDQPLDLRGKRGIVLAGVANPVVGAGGSGVTNLNGAMLIAGNSAANPLVRMDMASLQQDGNGICNVTLADTNAIGGITGCTVKDMNHGLFWNTGMRYLDRGIFFNGGGDNAWHSIINPCAYGVNTAFSCKSMFGMTVLGGDLSMNSNGVGFLVDGTQAIYCLGTYCTAIPIASVGTGIAVKVVGSASPPGGGADNQWIGLRTESMLKVAEINGVADSHESGYCRSNVFLGGNATGYGIPATAIAFDIGFDADQTVINGFQIGFGHAIGVKNRGTNTHIMIHSNKATMPIDTIATAGAELQGYSEGWGWNLGQADEKFSFGKATPPTKPTLTAGSTPAQIVAALQAVGISN